MKINKSDPRFYLWRSFLWQSDEETKTWGLAHFGISVDRHADLSARMRTAEDAGAGAGSEVVLSMRDLRLLRDCADVVRELIGFEMHIVLGVDEDEFDRSVGELNQGIREEVRRLAESVDV